MGLMVNQRVGSQQPVLPRVQPHQHWVRRVESLFILACSVVFAVITGGAIGWLYSTLNSVTVYQPVMTILAAVGFAGFGFILSRSLAYRIQHKQPIKVVLVAVIFYEAVETPACFLEALHSVGAAAWLSDFTGVWHVVL